MSKFREENRENPRVASYPINSLFTKRWSPRSFLDKEIPNEVVYSLFEAARWAASANNLQPWRFILARTNEDREKFYEFILPGNLIWCKKASILAVILSKKVENGKSLRSHAFDTGMASANLALEAANKGLVSHFIGGINLELARTILKIPDDYEIHAAIAIGYQGDKEALPEELQIREKPNGRNEVNDFVFEGSME